MTEPFAGAPMLNRDYQTRSVLFAALLVILFAGIQSPAQEVGKAVHELSLSRPKANPDSRLQGKIVWKEVDSSSETPFLRVVMKGGSSRDYLIRTCDETCQRTILNCKGGEPCSIRGEVREQPPSILAEFVWVGPGIGTETKTTKTGHIFVRDTNFPKLGEAWRDPSGTVWGNMVTKDDGSPRFMTHGDAADYCKSIGAQLPSRADYTRLGQYMGFRWVPVQGVLGGPAQLYTGFEPQVLPNLNYMENGRVRTRYYWSSTLLPQDESNVYYFSGNDGGTESYSSRGSAYYSTVRCVVYL